MEKCFGERRPESEPEKGRIFEGWGVDDGEELKLQGEKLKRAKTSNTWVQQLVAMEDVKNK